MLIPFAVKGNAGAEDDYRYTAVLNHFLMESVRVLNSTKHFLI